MLSVVPVDPDEDRVLVERFLESRSDEAFRALYRRHSGRLYALACRMLGGAERGAEDAIQETWLRAVRGLAAFRRDSALSTWLCGILLNRCREVYRERARSKTEHLESTEEPSAGTSPALPERLDLALALEKLPDGYREVVVLHDVEGYTHEEIGGILEIEPGTSRSQLSRGREALRRYFRGREEGKEND